jgi:2-polyprenyl-3-methyl-5-hydroxy-6-metoxy-1,4-benzoquinol methylase
MTRCILDMSCNDGWLAVNLKELVTYHGIDLNPGCIERARARDVPGATFMCAAAEDAVMETWGLRYDRHPGAVPGPIGYDVVVAYELIEHVRDPDAVLAAMVTCCKPGGALFVSTPLGACSGGELPGWWLVEPKGHVRVYTAASFHALLDRHGTVEEIIVSGSSPELMVARVTVPG